VRPFSGNLNSLPNHSLAPKFFVLSSLMPQLSCILALPCKCSLTMEIEIDDYIGCWVLGVVVVFS
jgi:hypothetical protein